MRNVSGPFHYLLVALLVTVTVTGPGCSDEEEQQQQLPPHCNPISADHCLLPWPSSFYLVKDTSTKTGYRLAYPQEAMPINNEDKAVDPSRFNLLDGFSIGSQPLVYFKSGVSKEGLPTADRLADSLTDKSPIWIMEHGSGERVPLFAEIDANAPAKGDFVPALIIRPQQPLKFNTRYVVVLRSSLKDSQGQPLQPPASFRQIRDGEAITGDTLQAEQARIEEVLAFLEQQKVARKDVVLAWDFHTSSQEALTGNVLGMVETALTKIPANGPKFSSLKKIDFTDEKLEPNLLHRVEGQYTVPSFLEGNDKNAWLKLDGEGRPVLQGERTFPFYVHIPRCAEQATGPLPVLIYGHGIFGAPKAEISSGYHKKLLNRLCMVEVALYLHGMSELDIVDIVQDVVLDLSNFPRITDHLQQTQVNLQALVRLMQGSLLQDPSMAVGGKPVTDGKEIYYLGISLGGTVGVPFVAQSKEIQRAIFHVGGGWWSMMMQRSSNWHVFDVMLEKIYEDPLDVLILVHLAQHHWDYTDPIVWASYLRSSPLPGQSPKRVVVQESMYDDQVPNMATRAVARAIGLQSLAPLVEEVYGLPAKAGPMDSAFAQWNFNPPLKPPGTNVPAPKPKSEDSAHDSVRRMESWTKQVEGFFKPDGQVVNHCDGACDPQ